MRPCPSQLGKKGAIRGGINFTIGSIMRHALGTPNVRKPETFLRWPMMSHSLGWSLWEVLSYHVKLVYLKGPLANRELLNLNLKP